MVKTKVFEMKPENSQVITDFLAGVNLMENGILVSENNVGFLYQDKTEVGLDVDGAVSVLTKELIKSQKQYITADNLINSYNAVIDLYKAQDKETQADIDLVEEKIATQKAIYAEKESIILEAERVANHIKTAWKKAPKSEKEKLLKEFGEAQKDLDAKRAEFVEFTKGHTVAMDKLNAELAPLKLQIANHSGEIKVMLGHLYDRDTDPRGGNTGAVKSKEDASVFIKVTMKKIADLKANGFSM